MLITAALIAHIERENKFYNFCEANVLEDDRLDVQIDRLDVQIKNWRIN